MATILTNTDTGESLEFDTVTSINFSPTNVISDHPLESGVAASDHSQAQPLTISLQGAKITESPLQNLTKIFDLDRVAAAREFLEQARGVFLTLECRWGLYSNLQLEAFPHTMDKMQHVVFNIQLKEVRIAQVESIFIPAEKPLAAYKDTVSDAVDVGPQSTVTPSAAETEVLTSDAKKLAQSFGYGG